MRLKVCGMKLNTAEVAALRPDYLGFIFWEPSSRYFEGEIPHLPQGIEKIGVFVDASIEEILEKVDSYNFQGVQLHGNESPEFCKRLQAKLASLPRRAGEVEATPVSNRKHQISSTPTKIKIIKVFSIKNTFDFGILKPYEEVCDYYLFDTKGELPGGNGFAFDWKVLANYPSIKPYFLSGGIGLEQVDSLKEFMDRPESKYCHAIDVNSRFETEPGLKDLEKLNEFRAMTSLKSRKKELRNGR